MFYVWDINGAPRPYRAGEFKRSRRVESPLAPRKLKEVEEDLDEELHVHPGIEAYQDAKERQESGEALEVRDIMSMPVETLTPQTTVGEAWEFIRTHRFRHVPVLENGTMVGLISDRHLFDHLSPDQATVDNPLRGIMEKEVLTARPQSKVREVARLMFEERVGALPIVDDTGTLVGIVTRSDILRTVVHFTPLERWV